MERTKEAFAEVEDKPSIIADYKHYLENKAFPCVAAKAALAHQQIHCMVAGHMACPKDDFEILQFIYSFIDTYRKSGELYHSAAIIFQQPTILSEETFDQLLWERLQSLSDLDANKYGYDKRVAMDPQSPDFSFSLKEEAFFIIGLHPGSNRVARQFKYPTLVFNPHKQFEQLRATDKYQYLQKAVRKKDVAISGSVNPMLDDYGESSEVYQYSGRKYDSQWQCPLKIKHDQSTGNTAA
ncbi:guanitoxin biosynthesis heme-dependent pre-guanitoxin N-hydroxylase GntA [Aridibaculum aurantiacum]|uniref:guanitoxin biosynthesis heme-dependent pre-guanitoxin N-hydroxylase GntA n=1 Tax=Aridibaculum aurantiacum TaxID=2810307 RepID=UPI001A95BF32|nr:guanitoxin biosynthesis heme-dependent pre-guanitoxin N-hydroxylase GntA [Aridibaculum aurantiacum]